MPRHAIHPRLASFWRPLFLAALVIAAVGGTPGKTVGAPPEKPPVAARAEKTYDLPELIALAQRRNPGLAAAALATEAIEAQLAEASRSWMPTGELTSLVAPVPEVICGGDPNVPKDVRERNCIETPFRDANIRFQGVFTRTELRLVQPVYTFGKIEAGKRAAAEGVKASEQREAGVVADLVLNVKRAYYGTKLAREIEDVLGEGRERLKTAQDLINKQLKEGTGDASPIDRFRLIAIESEVEIRTLETRRGGEFARNGLRALIGPDAPPVIELDPAPLEPVELPERPLAHYEELARLSRPEVRALDHLLASKRALADLEWRRQFPDLVLLGTATYAYASSIDNPQNTFYNDPFNTFSGGLAAALRFPLDVGVRNARAGRARAEAAETAMRRREALGGIAFEVQRAYNELQEAEARLAATRKGEKATRTWITAVAANFEAGLAEAKEFSDALLQWFNFRVRALQAIYDLNVAAAALARAVGAEITR